MDKRHDLTNVSADYVPLAFDRLYRRIGIAIALLGSHESIALVHRLIPDDNHSFHPLFAMFFS